MNRTPLGLHDPEEIVPHITPSLRALRDGLRHGIAVAESVDDLYFEDTDEEPWHTSHTVRRAVMSYLLALPPTDSWKLKARIPLSGIEIEHPPFRIKVWKSAKDGYGPRSPGSDTQRLFVEPPVYDMEPEGGNLIVDWSVGSDREPVMGLSRPGGTWMYWEKANLLWTCQVILPDEGLAFAGSIQTSVPPSLVLESPERIAVGGAR